MDGGTFAEPSKELVASNPEPRNWKGIIISILVILSVILLVALAVLWMTPPDPGPRVRGERLRLDHILEERYKPVRFNASYVGSRLVYLNHLGGLTSYSPLDGSTTLLLDNTTFRSLNTVMYRTDASLQYVMIIFDVQSIFRHSTMAKYTILNIKDRMKPLLRVGLSPSSDLVQEQEFLQYAAFRPGGGVVFVSKNDIFYLDSIESGGKVHQLTNTGVSGTLYNGVADWLYEEEILGQTEAIWFSGEGSRMLFATFNDTDVNLVTLREYGNQNYRTSTMTREKSFRYPKAGTKNPRVSLSVYTFTGKDGGQTVHVTPPLELLQIEHYFISGKWISEDRAAVLWTNRAQNTTVYTICAYPHFQCKQVYVERVLDTPGSGWVDHWGVPLFSKEGKEMIKIHPIREGELGYYPQLVYVPVSTTDLIPVTQLTQGRFEVTQILGWDEQRGLVYYMSTLEGRPGERHLHRVSLKAGSKPELLSSTAQEDEQECLYSAVHLSPNFDSYVQECLGPEIPWTVVVSLPDNMRVHVLDTNNRLKQQVHLASMPKIQFLEVGLPGTEVKGQVKMTLPPVLREGEDFKFPLIVHVYGGPGTQLVDRRWSIGWDSYLASSRDFIVASVDVRGSGFQGLDFKHVVRGRLGTIESQDIIHAVRNLVHKHKFIDETKVCVWGWSYGGYLAGRILSEDGRSTVEGRRHLFHCGIAVAPVSEWQNYDSAYTEKYMGQPTPEGNWKGYLEASLMNKVEYIPDNSFLVLHGTADDNVHVHHTMVLSRQLVHSNVIFRQQLYPDENHGLFGVLKHQHLTMEAFLDDVFGPIEDFFRDDYFMAAANIIKEMNQEESCYLC